MWADVVLRSRGWRADLGDGEAGDQSALALAPRMRLAARSLRTGTRRTPALHAGRASRGIALGAAAAGVLGVTVISTVIGVTSPIVDHSAVFVTLRTVACVGLLVIALTMGLRGASGRMAGVVVMSAGLLGLSGLTAADAALPFALGRISVSLALLMIVYACFAYPTGRVEDRPARRLIAASATAIGALLAANLLLSNVHPVAGPFTRCSGSVCPANPLNVVSVSPTAGRALSTSLALLTACALAATAVMLARRAVRATALQRRSLTPLLAWASTAALGYGFFVTVRALDQNAPLLTPGAIVVAAIIAAMPLALALAIARGRVFAMSAVEHLIAEIEAASSLAGLQRTLGRAFADPPLQLLLWHAADECYVDVDERPVDMSAIGPGRSVAAVSRGDEPLALVVHDPVLPSDVLDAAASAIRLALDNARLQVTLSASIRALEASRKRVARAADEERRRIERDLHDGAQQGLIALRIRLQMLEEVARNDPRAVAPALADAGRRVQAALDDIRDLAHGIYPSVLSDLGLAYALADVARRLPVQVTLRVDLPCRVPPDVETAVYFCCVEALQNVAKHCGADTHAELSLSEVPDGLRFVLADSGPGFDPALAANSHGITGMRDRLEAIGGRLTIRSQRGRGCRVSGHVPLRPERSAERAAA
jgi:signal transduction histidine kinase